MKKLLFTAIALVAFSSVSMANTIADEEKELSQTNVLISNPCRSTFEYYFNQGLSGGYSADESWAWASLNYDMCERGITWASFF